VPSYGDEIRDASSPHRVDKCGDVLARVCHGSGVEYHPPCAAGPLGDSSRRPVGRRLSAAPTQHWDPTDTISQRLLRIAETSQGRLEAGQEGSHPFGAQWAAQLIGGYGLSSFRRLLIFPCAVTLSEAIGNSRYAFTACSNIARGSISGVRPGQWMESPPIRTWRVQALEVSSPRRPQPHCRTLTLPSSLPCALHGLPHAAFLWPRPLTVGTPPPMSTRTADTRSST